VVEAVVDCVFFASAALASVVFASCDFVAWAKVIVELPSKHAARRKAPVAREKLFMSKKPPKKSKRPEGRGLVLFSLNSDAQSMMTGQAFRLRV
jgi:hypothetical protein